MAKVGRPSKYDVKYCQQLIDHMAQGFSFESFGAVIDTAEQTLHNWLIDFPEFLEAKREAFTKSRMFWEQIGVTQAKTGVGNSTAFVFNMKNRFPKEWRDKQDLTLAGDPENPLVTKIVREIVRSND